VLPPGDEATGFEPALRDGVFELARVQPLDMFPQTCAHGECVRTWPKSGCDKLKLKLQRTYLRPICTPPMSNENTPEKSH